MKKYSPFGLGILILLMISLSQLAIGQKSEVEPLSKLVKVTVYTDRAMIEKEALLSVTKGENVVCISGITPNLLDQTVQVSLMGQNDLAISEVTVEETYLKKADHPEMVKLQTRLTNLISQINELTNQIGVISSSSDFLKKVNPFPQNLKVSIADIEAHTRFLEKTLSVNFDRMALLDTKVKKLNEEKVALENELAAFNSGNNKSKTIVIHLLSLSGKSNVKLGFTYLTTQAGWSSLYEARGDLSTSKIDLNYFTSIWQSTGEDWSDVNMEISTAKPFIYGNIPQLTPWYVDLFTPRLFRSQSLVASDNGGAPNVMMAKAASPVEEKEFEETAIQEENTSFTFVLPRKVDIISDGQPHRVLIATSIADAKYSWFTVPKLVQSALLKAKVLNPFTFPLLSGPVSVFSNQKMVGTALINAPVLAAGELELSLGVDEGIKLERKLVKKFTDYAGILSRETSVNFEYSIEITNGKNKEITLELNDQFPISRNEKIKIEWQSPQSGEATISEEGKITWNILLAPGAKKSMPIKYKVTYPKDLTVTGL